MGFFEKHKKTGYGVFYNIDNSGTKNLHTIPFSGFYLAAKTAIVAFAARFPSSSILSNQLLGLFPGKVAVALCGVFPFGRAVGFLAQVARPRPYGKNNIELSQINGEAIRGTVKPARSNTGRPKGKAKMGYDGGLFWDGGFQGGEAPLAYLTLRSKGIVSYHVYIRDHGYTMLRVEIYFVDNK